MDNQNKGAPECEVDAKILSSNEVQFDPSIVLR